MLHCVASSRFKPANYTSLPTFADSAFAPWTPFLEHLWIPSSSSTGTASAAVLQQISSLSLKKQANHLNQHTVVTLVLCHSTADRRCRYYYTNGHEETVDAKLIFEEPRRFLIADVRVVYNSREDDEKDAILSDSEVTKVKQLLRRSAIPVDNMVINCAEQQRIEGAERISEVLESIPCVRKLDYDFSDVCHPPEILQSGAHVVSKLLRSGNVERLTGLTDRLSAQRQTEIFNWMKSGQFKSFYCESHGTPTYYDRFLEALIVDWLTSDMPKDVELLVTPFPESLRQNTPEEMSSNLRAECSWMQTEQGDIAYVLRRINGEKRMIVLPAEYRHGIGYKELEDDGRYDRMVEAERIMSDREVETDFSENSYYLSDYNLHE